MIGLARPMPDELIPHQLHLTLPQVKKMVKGLPTQIPMKQMGSGAGDHVIFLHPENAHRLLGSYRKGKGVRLTMSPTEIHHSLQHGRGFLDTLKKGVKSVGRFLKGALKNPVVKELGKEAVHYGAEALGTAVGAYFGNPMAGAMLGDAIGRAGESVIDHEGNLHHAGQSLKTDAVKAGKSALLDVVKTEIKDPRIRAVAQSVITGDAPSMEAGTGIRKGRGRPKKVLGKGYGEDTIKDALHKAEKLISKPISGKGMKKGSAEMKEKMAKLRAMRKGGQGLYGGGMWDWADPKKNGVAKAFDPKQNGVANAFQKTFTPALGNEIVSGLKTAGHYAIPAITGALGSVAGTALTGNPVGGVAGSALGSYAGNQIDKKLGIGAKRGRGRPRKMGAGASMSAPYKNAMKMNFDGLELNNTTAPNAPASAFSRDPRVRPSSTEMTMSPYQSITSPAMNPFVPTTYTQEGGASCGYGGRGLKGKGLYGGGLF